MTGETERQRDRETERQRDRETQRHRDTETERHRDTETNRQRNIKTKYIFIFCQNHFWFHNIENVYLFLKPQFLCYSFQFSEDSLYDLATKTPHKLCFKEKTNKFFIFSPTKMFLWKH